MGADSNIGNSVEKVTPAAGSHSDWLHINPFREKFHDIYFGCLSSFFSLFPYFDNLYKFIYLFLIFIKN